MIALALLLARTLLVLLAFPLGVLVTRLVLLHGTAPSDGDGGLVVFPWMLVIISVLVVSAVLFNNRFLHPSQPEPYWLQSVVIRYGLRLVILVAAVALLFIA